MAFEAFLAAHQRGARRFSGGCGPLVSIGAHVAPVALALGVGFGAGTTARPDARLGTSAATAVPVRLALRLPSAAAAPRTDAAIPAPPPAAAPATDSRWQGRTAPRRRRPAAPPPSEARAAPERSAVAAAPAGALPRPVLAAPAPDLASASATAPDDADGAGAAPLPALAALVGGHNGSGPGGAALLTSVAPSRPARARASAPAFLPASFAKGLRIRESFPRLPAELDRRGAHYSALIDVCVSARGAVTGTLVRQASAPALDRALVEAIATWRYTPFVVDGAPAPFCHPLRITYVRR